MNKSATCPICGSARIKMDRYYTVQCKDCKSEWKFTSTGKRELIADSKKEIIL